MLAINQYSNCDMLGNFAVIVPMANEESRFNEFVDSMRDVLDVIGCGLVYFVLDNASKDNTLKLCNELQEKDNRFNVVWRPENRNVVDAYISGYREALKNNHEIIIEMDAGMSHDPRAIPMFLRVLNEGNECAFGSRFINGGSIYDSIWWRTFLSKTGTYLSNFFLGTKLHDATSGYQAFHAKIASQIVDYDLRSNGHFYQTEIRYLLKGARFIEVPIHYRAPSPSVSNRSIINSFLTLMHYFVRRIKRKEMRLL